jgi:hypothetical protein
MKHERTTACIRNSGFSAKSKFTAFNEGQSQTESKVLLIRYFSYTQNVGCNRPAQNDEENLKNKTKKTIYDN